MQRMGLVIGITKEGVAEYRRLHRAVWPEVIEAIERGNIRNYSIYLREPENLLFSYWEYHGDDYEGDMNRMFADPKVEEWMTLCGPLQAPLESRAPGEWWASTEEVFHVP
jgi:L-rhamnose mutarotase